MGALFLVIASSQRQPNPRRQPRIGQRPVQGRFMNRPCHELPAEEVPGHRFEPVIRQGRKGPPAELQGAVMAIGQAEAQTGDSLRRKPRSKGALWATRAL